MLATGLATLAPVTAASANHDVTPARVAGENRTDTAADIAELQYADGADRALLGRDDAFPDALAASALAQSYDAPILLTNTDELSERTDEALEKLGVKSITILGGENAVSADVEQDLEFQGYSVTRVEGEDRYATSAEMAKLVHANNGEGANFPGDTIAAFVATGEDFKDALAAGPLAAHPNSPTPTLLTAGDELPASTEQALQDMNVENAFVVGGELAVSQDVVAQIESHGISVQRIAGPNAAWTAAELANFAGLYLDFDASEIVVSRSDLWADALAAGPFAGEGQDPILLSGSPDDEIPVESADWTQDACENVSTVRAIGGTAAVTQAELEAFETAAETDCHDDEDGRQTFIVAPQEAQTVSAGVEFTFDVGARYDGQTFDPDTGLDIALFPCEDVSNETGSGHPEFRDRNTDNLADGIASTNTGNAVITAVEGETLAQPATSVRDAVDTDGDDTVSVTVRSDAADCAVVTFFDNANNNSALDLDPSDDAAEHYGIGKITWS